ncbi:TPA: PA3496 family putative envelope integrity protein [Vibrio parahaemolyticus]|nr:hypothetical protein [Vibrio parahaemolyticus]
MNYPDDHPFSKRLFPVLETPNPSSTVSQKAKRSAEVRRRIETLEERRAWQQEWGGTFDDEWLQ